MRVVFPLGSLVLAGGVKNTLLMAAGLATAGHQVAVIAPDFSPTPPFPLPTAVGLRVLATGPRLLPLALRKAIYYARLALESTGGSDVCPVPYYLTVYTALSSALLRRGRCRVLYIVSAYEPLTHGSLAEAGAWSRLARSLLARWSYRLPVEKVYVSRWLAQVTGDPAGRTIALGINHQAFHPPAAPREDGVVRIGVIARSGPIKGYGDFLAACRGGLRVSAPIELVIVAVDAVEVPEGLAVRVLGPQGEPGMGDFYRQCHIFVFPSWSEGFPAPPLEAMACGSAVVATRCGGVEEYARDGVNCLLVPTRDPSALRAAIERLVEDKGLRSRLAAEGMRTAAPYTPERTLMELRALVEGGSTPQPALG